MEEEEAYKRKVVVQAFLALLNEEEEDAARQREFEDDLSLVESAYAEEDRVQEATLRERLQARLATVLCPVVSRALRSVHEGDLH